MDWEASGSRDNGVPQTVSTPDGKPPKGKKKWPIVLAVLVILIILARISSCVSGCGSTSPSKSVDTFTWPSSGLATELPKPKTNKGEISSNSDTHFYATLQEVSHSDYDDYIKSCKTRTTPISLEKEPIILKPRLPVAPSLAFRLITRTKPSKSH